MLAEGFLRGGPGALKNNIFNEKSIFSIRNPYNESFEGVCLPYVRNTKSMRGYPGFEMGV